MDINGVNIQIHKSWYNKSHIQEDGVTHIVDTEHQYPVYQLGMAKNYFDIEDRVVVIDSIITDLKEVIAHLEQMKTKEEQSKGFEKE